MTAGRRSMTRLSSGSRGCRSGAGRRRARGGFSTRRRGALRELRRAREAGRARADDRDALAGATRRHRRRDPAFIERAVGDRALGRFDRHRGVVDRQHARGFARRGTDAAGEVGEVVGRGSFLYASCQRPCHTASAKSGIGLPSGQPRVQNGTPQSMQRPAPRMSSATCSTSCQSRRRSAIGRRCGAACIRGNRSAYPWATRRARARLYSIGMTLTTSATRAPSCRAASAHASR